MFVQVQELQAKLGVGGPVALAKPLQEAFLLQCQKKVTHGKALLPPFVPSMTTRGQCKPRYGEDDAGSFITARKPRGWSGVSQGPRK